MQRRLGKSQVSNEHYTDNCDNNGNQEKLNIRSVAGTFLVLDFDGDWDTKIGVACKNSCTVVRQCNRSQCKKSISVQS